MKYKILAVLLWLGLSISAQTMTLEEAWQQILRSNPELLAEKESIKSSEADVKLALYDLMPSGSLSGSYNRDGDSFLNDDNMTYRVSLSQPLYQGGNLFRSLDNSKILLEKQENQYSSLLLSKRVDLEKKYYSVLEKTDLLQEAEKELEFIEKNIETAKLKFDSGFISKGELLQWQSQKAQQQVIVLQNRNSLKIAETELQNLLNTDSEIIPAQIKIEEYESHILSLAETDINQLNDLETILYEYSIKNNPAFINSILDKELKENDVKSSKSKFYPTLSLSLSRNWSYQNLDADPQGDLSLGINASVPLLPIADNIQNYAKSRYSLQQTEYTYLNDDLELRTSIRSNMLNLIAATTELKASEIALEYAQETYRQAEEQFNNNTISSNELLDMQITLSNAENQLTGKFYNFLENKALLQQTLGMLDEDELWAVLSSNGR